MYHALGMKDTSWSVCWLISPEFGYGGDLDQPPALHLVPENKHHPDRLSSLLPCL